MKKIEIYLKEELIFSMLVEDYELNTYTNGIDIECKIKELTITYSLPTNKGYRILADV